MTDTYEHICTALGLHMWAESSEKTVPNESDIDKWADSNFSEWYVGIAANPRERLAEHGIVEEDESVWEEALPLWKKANNDQMARKAERFFLDRGAKGGPGGGDEDSVFVYAYRIGPNTNENA